MQKPPTERSWRKYFMRHACPASWLGQDYLTAILLRFYAGESQKCDWNHTIYMQNNLHIMQIMIAVDSVLVAILHLSASLAWLVSVRASSVRSFLIALVTLAQPCHMG